MAYFVCIEIVYHLYLMISDNNAGNDLYIYIYMRLPAHPIVCRFKSIYPIVEFIDRIITFLFELDETLTMFEMNRRTN